jgi:hypothetical protein
MSQTLTQGKVMTTHEQIVAAYENYLAENAKFSDKGVTVAGSRARKALQEIAKAVKVRRAEITEIKNQRKESK